MQTIELYPQPPFDFNKTTRKARMSKLELFQTSGGKLMRAIRIDGQIYVLGFSMKEQGTEPTIEVCVDRFIGVKETDAIAKLASRMFSTEIDLHPFYNHFQQDAPMFQLCSRQYGLKLLLDADPFECMMKTLIGQQLNLSFAAELVRRLIAVTNEPYRMGDLEFIVFPSADQVAALTYDQLRQLQFSQRKAEYVIDFARIVAEGALDLQALFTFSDDEVIARLTDFRGIGRWSAECFLLFGLGRTNLLPAADIGLRNALKKLYGMDYQPKEAEVRAFAEKWDPWCSYATFYLWESLSLE